MEYFFFAEENHRNRFDVYVLQMDTVNKPAPAHYKEMRQSVQAWNFAEDVMLGMQRIYENAGNTGIAYFTSTPEWAKKQYPKIQAPHGWILSLAD